MGFDLIGLQRTEKKDKDGNYIGDTFRNNIWWWRNLWKFICLTCNDILTEKEKINGQWNHGTKISHTKTKKIVKTLQNMIDNGMAEKFEKNIKKNIKITKKNNKKLKPRDPNFDWNEYYPFTVDNLKNFIEFAENSGGFEIY